MKQLIPARGRKLLKHLNCPLHPHETTHPREGTETQKPTCEAFQSPKQLIPARGRKRRALEFARTHGETTHPREGTETKQIVKRPPQNPRNNSSPRGDGNNANGRLFFTNPYETTHPREGTETIVP